MIDEMVTAALLAEHRRHLGGAFQNVASAWTGEARLAEIDEEIATYMQARRNNEISPRSLIALLGPLEEERDVLMADRRRHSAQVVKREEMSVEVVEEWETLPIERKRALVRESISAVVVHPVGRGGRFDPDSVEISWRQLE
ncbi:hypothetical protein [Nonomuraea recticatena]